VWRRLWKCKKLFISCQAHKGEKQWPMLVHWRKKSSPMTFKVHHYENFSCEGGEKIKNYYFREEKVPWTMVVRNVMKILRKYEENFLTHGQTFVSCESMWWCCGMISMRHSDFVAMIMNFSGRWTLKKLRGIFRVHLIQSTCLSI
jgi:hypothetical protein